MSIYFSIVVPTYNRASFIEKTVLSLLSQNFERFEIIVVDDGSTDDTGSILEGIPDTRLSYHKKPNGERGAARNFGTKLARGKYVNFFDSDDLAYKNHLAAAFEMIDSLHEPEVVHMGFDVKTPDGIVEKVVNDLPSQANKSLLSGNHLSCNGVFVRKDIAEKFPFSENRILSASEDYALWLKLSARFPIHCSAVVTSSIINHEARSVVTTNFEKLLGRLDILRTEITEDQVFLERNKRSLGLFYASLDLYLALHLAMMKKRAMALSYLAKAIVQHPPLLINRKVGGVLKNILLN